MTQPTTAQRLIDFRQELASSNGFGEDLLTDILRDAAQTIITREGLTTRLETAPDGEVSGPSSPSEG